MSDSATQTIYALVALVSSVGGVLAWVAKLRWSAEFQAAKEAELKAKDQQIQLYKEMSSRELIEYFKSVKEALENALVETKKRLEEGQHETEMLKDKIEDLKKSKATTAKQLQSALEQAAMLLEKQKENAKEDYIILSRTIEPLTAVHYSGFGIGQSSGIMRALGALAQPGPLNKLVDQAAANGEIEEGEEAD